MKKILAWIAVACCICLLTACSQQSAEDMTAEQETTEATEAVQNKTSPIQQLTIDGLDIKDYVIVSRSGAFTQAATLIQSAVDEATGYQLEIVAGSQLEAGKPAIVLCSSGYGSSAQYSAAEDSYGIYSENGNVYICGGNEMMELYGAKEFVYTVMGFNTKLGTAQNSQVVLEQLNVTGEFEEKSVNAEEEFFTYSQLVMEINGPFPDALTYNTLQGCCSDGKYAYFSLLDKASDAAGCSIFKYDMSDWSLVKVNYNVQVGHGNSMCYVDSRDQLMVVNYSSSMQVQFIDPDTLRIVDSKMLPFETYCATYNAERDEYVFGVKAAKKFYILDGSFNLVQACDINSTAGDQSVYCDDQYIYFIYYNPNCVVVYDWDCNYINTVYMDTTIEVESGFIENGELYLAYYISPGLGGQLYTMKIF